ncbi:hypothetical protein ACE14D_21485 [Streptomyces sp. Act-28]
MYKRLALVLVRVLLAGVWSPLAKGPGAARAGEDGPSAPTACVLQHAVIRRGPPTAVVLAA